MGDRASDVQARDAAIEVVEDARDESPMGVSHAPERNRGTIEIGEFSPGPRSPRTASRALVSVACALASTLFHIALISTAFGGGGGVRTPIPKPRGTETTRAEVTDEIAMQWVTLDDQTAATAGQTTAVASFSAPELTPIRLPPNLPLLAIPLLEETLEPATIANDGAGAATGGGYLGQISARIDRAWLRPRTPIGEADFRCQVRIEQDAAGSVTEVMLERCNGSPRWQLSLVHAIESASPLPVPPDPALFVHALHMSFHAEPLDSAASTDQYEPESVAGQIEASDRQVAENVDPSARATRRLNTR